MSRLRKVPGNRFEDLLAAAPGALEADTEMWQKLRSGISPRVYSLIGVSVASALGLEALADSVKGGLDEITQLQVKQDWRNAPLNETERAILAYAEKGTLDESSVRKKDVDALREVGLLDSEILTIATAIAYHNYAFRVAAALGVKPRESQ